MEPGPGPKGKPTLSLKFGSQPTTFAFGLKKSGHLYKEPLSAGAFAWRALGNEIRPGGGKEPRANVNPDDLSEAGWAVLWADEETRDRLSAPLAPLLDLRRREAGDLFRQYIFEPGQTAVRFLKEAGGVPASPADAESSAPYYLLLVGDPNKVPFTFQQDLDLRYAVGRLSFERDEDYAAYARAMVNAEEGRASVTKKAAFFGVQHPGDPVTAQCLDQLIKPLADEASRREGWSAEQVLGENATKKALRAMLSCQDRPALFVTAGHSPVLDKDDPLQRELHGGLVTADWKSGEVGPSHVFGPRDLDAEINLQGMIVLQIGCFTGGTPHLDPVARPERIELATEPFVGALARGWVSRGALASVAHVDSLYLHSFAWPGVAARPQHQTYGDMLHHLMIGGRRLGHAMDTFGRRYGELATYLMAARLEPERYTEEEFSAFWIGYHDARQFIVVGDPAVRQPL